MKKVLLAALVATSTIYAKAQMSIAPEVGANFAKAMYDIPATFMMPDVKSRIGLRAGAVVNILVYKGFFVQPGLFFSMKGFGMEESTSVFGITSKFEASYNINYFELPLNIGYQYDFGKAGSAFITAGPYLGYAIMGNYTAKIMLLGNVVEDVDKDINFGSGVTEMNPMDIGLNFGLGYKFPIGLYIRGQYGLGLSNLANDDEGSVKNSVISVSLGYAFKL